MSQFLLISVGFRTISFGFHDCQSFQRISMYFNNKQINGVGVRLLPYVPPIYSMSLHLSINVATVKPKHSVFQYFVLYTRKRNILSNFKCNSLLEEEVVVVVDDEDDSNEDAMDVMLLLVVVGLDGFM